MKETFFDGQKLRNEGRNGIMEKRIYNELEFEKRYESVG